MSSGSSAISVVRTATVVGILATWLLLTGQARATTLFAWETSQNLYTVNSIGATPTFVGGPNVSTLAEIEFGDGIIYGAETGINTNLHAIDPATGLITSTITLTFPPEGDVFTSLEFVGSTLYAGLTTEGGGPTFLSIVDTGTGLVTLVGPTGFGSPFGGLAYDGSTMYGISAGGSAAQLFTISLGSGAATAVGPVTIDGASFGGTTALEFGIDGVLYALPNPNSLISGHLLSIDPATGDATDLGDTGLALNALTAPAGNVWAVQPSTGNILRLDPRTGAIGGSFPAPGNLVPGHTVAGLTIAEGGSSLLYVNSDDDPTVLHRMHPDTGALLSTESIHPAGNRGGLGFETGPPDSIFVMNQGAGIDLQSGLSGPVAAFLTVVIPTAPGASGGDDVGRQFVWGAGLIQEYDPFLPDTVLNSFASPSPSLAGMAFDGQNLYVSDLAGDLFTLDPETGALLNVVNIPGGPLTGLAARGSVTGCGDGFISSPEECDPPGSLAHPDCCEEHDAPGCSDPTCEAQVCAIEPACCAGVWDGPCVDLALSQLGDCVGSCTDPAECSTECCLDSDGDEVCDNAGDPCTFGPNQGGEALFQTVLAVDQCDCCDSHPTSGCSNGYCEALVCANDPFCCDVEWDSSCVSEAETHPQCAECCLPQTFWWVHPLDYEVVRGSFVPSWEVGGYVEDLVDSGSSNLYVDPGLPGPGSGLWYLWEPVCPDASWSSGEAGEISCQAPSDCCVSDNPAAPNPQGCGDPICEGIICDQNPFCCGSEPSCDCCTEHAGPGCVDPSCTGDVCSIDPDCCSASGWDVDCVDLAKTIPRCVSCCGYWDGTCANEALAIETCVNSCNGELCRTQPSPLP